MSKCPFCNNLVSSEAEFCEHCNESLKIQCPYCKEYINVNDRICPFCSTKLRTNSISILTKITYFLLFVNALLPYWFSNSIIKHPVFWHEQITKKEGFEDWISFFVSILVISAIPSIIGIISNYRKIFFGICIIVLIVLCIFNLILVCQIQ